MPEEQDIRGFLADTFADHSPEPDRDLWAGIEANIHQPAKRKLGWVWYGGIAAAIVLLMALWVGRNSGDKQQIMPNLAEEVQPRVDSTPLYPERKLVQKRESEEVSPEDTLPSSPVLPTPEPIQKSTPLYVNSVPVRKPVEDSQDAQSQLAFEDSSTAESTEVAVTDPKPEVVVAAIEDQEAELPVGPTEILAEEVPPVHTSEVVLKEEEKNGFSLKDLTFEKAIYAASEELDKRFDDSPISARTVEEKGQTVKTFRVKIGGFSITHKKRIRNSKSERT